MWRGSRSCSEGDDDISCLTMMVLTDDRLLHAPPWHSLPLSISTYFYSYISIPFYFFISIIWNLNFSLIFFSLLPYRVNLNVKRLPFRLRGRCWHMMSYHDGADQWLTIACCAAALFTLAIAVAIVLILLAAVCIIPFIFVRFLNFCLSPLSRIWKSTSTIPRLMLMTWLCRLMAISLALPLPIRAWDLLY